MRKLYYVANKHRGVTALANRTENLTGLTGNFPAFWVVFRRKLPGRGYCATVFFFLFSTAGTKRYMTHKKIHDFAYYETVPCSVKGWLVPTTRTPFLAIGIIIPSVGTVVMWRKECRRVS